MRYLKRFNGSKQLDQSVVDECKDILLELEDIGIKTHVVSYFNSGVIVIDYEGKHDTNWISINLTRKEEFQYSDIEDVVERLKSYLSEYNLHIQWQSPTERKEQKPTIKVLRVVNPMNFQIEGVKTACELHFNNKS